MTTQRFPADEGMHMAQSIGHYWLRINPDTGDIHPVGVEYHYKRPWRLVKFIKESQVLVVYVPGRMFTSGRRSAYGAAHFILMKVGDVRISEDPLVHSVVAEPFLQFDARAHTRTPLDRFGNRMDAEWWH